MMKIKKIAPVGNDNRPIEDLVNAFFQRENISKSDVVHIRPISMTNGGVSDLVAVYVGLVNTFLTTFAWTSSLFSTVKV